ncbi:major facilitator superfamily domain-containing protein [Podospora fimiseda]|uniref:Major facilitator superfamily domain-containing protein n=1 Tax=Podospora fimiseda TaxID=252190 RepID=A0AAN7BI83_9PEZI|nr:major facilitator superfamily domain-containing protein [Podospora fimiseda]
MSEFGALSALGSLFTASIIVFAVVKVPTAKLSNAIGRGYTLAVTLLVFVLSYVLMASASNATVYSAGTIFYRIGQSGTNIMVNVVISDMTSLRQRGLALAVFYFPFLITPWVSGFIVESFVDGIGWRWGIGMFSILMPFGASILVGTLVRLDYRSRKSMIKPSNGNIQKFCSDIDLGGILLFIAGFSLLLLPLTIAGSLENGWRTPWVPTLMAVGVLILLLLVVYENRLATNPIVPATFFKDQTIVFSFLLVAIDSLSFSCTHTYMYAWATVSHNMIPRDATFYYLTSGVSQCLIGILAGFIMLLTGRYKWLVTAGAVIRLVGYGLMIRLRGQYNSMAELFIQQLIQGIGSGIIQSCLLVAPQVVVPHAQISQVLSLTMSVSFLGYSVGSAIAGGIYTNTLRPELWKYMATAATPEIVDELYNSITGVLPEWGTPQRDAVNLAYTAVMRNFAYTALGASALLLILCFFLPNLLLPREQISIVSKPVSSSDDSEKKEEALSV